MGLPLTTSFMKWTPSDGNRRGMGTSGMNTHIQNSCRAELNFSALAQLIGDLRSNMLASKVERMIIRLNRHLVDEVHELDAVNAQARARVAKSAQKSAAAIRRGQACRLTLPYRFHEWPCEWYPVSACPCFSCFANVLGFTLSVCLLLMYHQGVITNP